MRNLTLLNPQDPSLPEFLVACQRGLLSRVSAIAQGRPVDDGFLTAGLREALKNDQTDTARYLLGLGTYIDASTVSSTRSISGFQTLLQHGWDVNSAMPYSTVMLP